MKASLPPNETLRLETLAAYNILDTDPEPAFDDLTQLAAEICQTPIALITLIDEKRQWFKSTVGLSATETSRDVAFCAHAILESTEVLEVSDAHLDPRFADNPLVTDSPHVSFYAGAPLVAVDGVALGTLCVVDRVPRTLTPEQRAALRALSRTVIAQLELRRTLVAHRQVEEQLHSINTSLERKVEKRTAALRREIEVRRESEQNLRQAQILAHIGSWTADMTGKLTWSEELYRVYGVTPETFKLNVDNFIDLIHPDDQLALHTWIAACGSGQKPAAVEYRCIWPDGSLHVLKSQGALILDAQGIPSHMSGTAQDISEQKNARATLQTALDFSNNLIHFMQDGFVVLDKNGISLDNNPALCRMTGFSYEELFGSSAPFPYWPPEEYDNLQSVFQKTLNGDTRNLELTFMRKNGERFPVIVGPSIIKDETGNIINFTATIKDITERSQAAAKIEHLAYHDQLTRLPNRSLLLDRLQQVLVSSLRNERTGALLFIDLDNFKSLNDTLGHAIGDLLLLQVAQRLESCVRADDTVARLGGDEFVVMLVDMSKQPFEAAAQVESIGEKILASLSETYQLDAHDYRCTASIGITLFSNDQQTANELMKQADIAMYQAKKSGRNALRFFDQQMQDSISARMALENELHIALAAQQFQLYYQIQVDSAYRALGAEALIRWQHPERGLILPDQFIPLMEETGMILPVGLWVLNAACIQLKAWQQRELTNSLVLAVNVSARQFRQPDFVAQIQAAVQRHHINPKLLKLELTESLLQENIEDTIAIMNALNDIGIQFSLDDFGTGYSSLQYLKRLPLDQLKIDQSFVQDIAHDTSDKAIVRTIIAISHSLDLDVIAEGVETEEQRQALLRKGCKHFQGFLFGRPVPLAQFEAQLTQDQKVTG